MKRAKKIYLDHAASTPVDPEVVLAMEPYWNKIYANPSSLHICGQESIKAIDEAREIVQKFLNAKMPREIIFTASATEANNLAIRGIIFSSCAPQTSYADTGSRQSFNKKDFNYCRCLSARRLDRDKVAIDEPKACACAIYPRTMSASLPRVITTVIEHSSILEPIRALEKEGLIEAAYLDVNREGMIDLDELKKALSENTVLVSIGYANNEIGVIQPILEISKIIREFRSKRPTQLLYFHTDAVQAIQFLEIDVEKLGVDMMTISAHKIYGPKGIGALYVRDGIRLDPVIYGGGQEYGLRSGTENVPLIVGFAKAIEILAAWRKNSKNIQKVQNLRDYLWEQLKSSVSGMLLNGPEEKRLPNHLSVFIPEKDSETVLVALSEQGVCVSNGAACASRSQKPSHVIGALGRKREGCNLRITFGRGTSRKELDAFMKIFLSLL
ncbi:cysteine desulfurase [Patescibacteria group bacterium]|nr:cysteine desulfurase [Patescibacteria group bacterium]